MSKADTLRASASFGQARGGISARRAAIEAAATAPTDGAPPPLKLPVDVISLNPDNPREVLGDLTDLGASLRDHKQKTAISIMSRFAYLEGNPGRADDLEKGTKYVVIDGNSRLAAAREAGLTQIKVMLDDELGSNPDEILESAFVANVHRQDLDPLDEAKVLQRLLEIHKTQDALAARLHRSQGWVSQRLALLGLTPELKEKLQTGEESAALLRRVGKKKPEEQEEHLRRLKEKEKKTPQRGGAPKRAAIPAPTPPAQDYYAVMKPVPDGDQGADSTGSDNTIGRPSNVRLAPSENDDTLPPTQSQQQGEALMDAAFDQLDNEQRSAFILRYFQRSTGIKAVTADMRGNLRAEARSSLADILQQVAAALRVDE
ncbi:ParB/RepB/Spo0J family partition protein [Streptomyces sp. NPDC048210]|uniref:ParB/RepB/Spo0J family partition protein n=1 Tax=unclassified Streptomyces TaxID=2593676 RepID=UPI002E75C1D8|nr:ParB/RepB/Spo0J family partition protein [Streptomyces sp. JV181]MEE1775539.1 ParB/RepB/Spo0J family partition protein [Streptomyces sp. JV181]